MKSIEDIGERIQRAAETERGRVTLLNEECKRLLSFLECAADYKKGLEMELERAQTPASERATLQDIEETLKAGGSVTIQQTGAQPEGQTLASERAHDEWWNSLTPDQRWQFQTGHQIASGAQPEGPRTPASERAEYCASCTHKRDAHSNGTGRCHNACPCKSFVSLDEHLSRIQLRLRAALRQLGYGDDYGCSQHLGDALREIAELRRQPESQQRLRS